MTDADALLASILAYPEDDLPRLVFADWLDEQGNESDAARASFIRVGCEIAKLERERVCRFNDAIDWKECTGISATWCGNCGDCSCKNREESMSDKGCPLHDPTSKHCCLEMLEYKESRLRKHERELWNANSGLWFGTRGPNPLPGDLGWAEDDDGLYIRTHGGRGRYVIRRGFCEEVRLPLKEFMGGGRCESCWVGEDGHAMRLVSECPFCKGTGRTEGIAKRLFASQPIQSVIATDCHPVRIGSVWNWMQRRHEPESPHFVGQELFDLLDLPYAYVGDDRMDAKCAPSEKEAVDGLSRAMVRLGRSLANLRHLGPVA